MNSPVEQFSIKILFALNLFGFDISFTNASLFMIISVFGSASIFYLGARKQTLVPNRFQSLVEISYEFVANMVKENAGKGSQIYFPFIFTLFMFILFLSSLSDRVIFLSVVSSKEIIISSKRSSTFIKLIN